MMILVAGGCEPTGSALVEDRDPVGGSHVLDEEDAVAVGLGCHPIDGVGGVVLNHAVAGRV
jgi:hypothetical protein